MNNSKLSQCSAIILLVFSLVTPALSQLTQSTVGTTGRDSQKPSPPRDERLWREALKIHRAASRPSLRRVLPVDID